MRIAAFLLSLILLVSCKKKTTSWDADWNIPILNDSITLNNYYNDSTLAINGSELNINLRRTVLNLGINDLIKIPDTTINQIFSPALNISNVPPGTEFVNTVEEHSLEIGDAELKKVIVKNGKIEVSAFNPLNTSVILTIEIPGTSLQGNVFSQSFILDPGTISNPSSATEILDIDGYEIDLTGENGMGFNKLQTRLTIQTDPDGDQIDITSNHDFEARAKIQDLTLNYAKGYFGNSIISELSTVIVEELSYITEGQIDLNLTELDIEIENGMKCLFSVTLNNVSNTNSLSNTVDLSSSNLGQEVIIPQALGSWTSLNPSIIHMQFNHSNSNFEEFIENLGTVQSLDYNIKINPQGNVTGGTDEIFPQSKIKVYSSLNAPLSVGLDGLTIRDTFDLNISQDQNKTHVNSGLFRLKAINSFPISASPVLYLMDENNTILHTVIGTAQISSSLMGELNVTSELLEKESFIDFIFDETMIDDLDILTKMIVELRFDSPNPVNGISELQNIPYGAKVKLIMSGIFNSTIVVP